VHRAALQSPDAGHTALTRLFTGRPARGIVNRFMRELGPQPLAPAFPWPPPPSPPARRRRKPGQRRLLAPVVRPEPLGCRTIGAGELTLALAGKAQA
jgi:nitronate monooxygenase